MGNINTKATALLLGTVSLLTVGHSLWGQQEKPNTWGRRLSFSTGGLLILTEPDMPPRVVLYDVSGDAPQKVIAFGQPGWLPGQLESPHGATISWKNELLVTNTYNHRIDSFDLTAFREGHYPRLLRTFGMVGKPPGHLDTPQWPVAVSSRRDLQDRVYVCDGGNHRIEVFERTGKLLMTIGGHGSEDGKLDRPMGIGMDPSGSLLYVAENGNRRVSVFAAQSGHFLTKFGVGGAEGGGGLAIPAGLAVAPSGIIYVADLGPRQIRRFKLTMDVKQQPVGATELPAWGKPGIGSGEFLKPYALAIDTQGRVYVADSENDHCQVFSADGAFIAAFGDDIDKLTPLSPPSGLSARLPDSVCSSGGSYRVRIKPSKNPVPSNEMMGLQAEVLEGCGEGAKPAEGVRLHVNAGMPEHQHGMTTQPRVLPLEGGRWDVAGLLFHMPGYWELYFDMEREGVVERAQMEFKLE